MNGGGNKQRAVHSYEVYLNGDRVIPTATSEYSHATVKASTLNSVKVVLVGEPTASIMLVLSYDPQRSN